MRPASGCSRPAIKRSSVDLPEPEGPRRDVISPEAASNETPDTAAAPAFGAKFFVTPVTATLTERLLRSSPRARAFRSSLARRLSLDRPRRPTLQLSSPPE